MRDGFLETTLRKQHVRQKPVHGGVGRAHAENALELRRSLGKLPLRNQDATNQLFGGNDVAVLRFSGQSPQLHERFVKLSFKEKLRTQRKARPRIVEHRLPQLDHRLVVISGRNQFRRQLGAGTPVVDQVKTPLLALMCAPAGAPTSKLNVSICGGASASVALAVKLKVWP